MRLLAGQVWVERLGWALVHFLWQGAAIGALYAVARRSVGRSRGPQLRYLLACVALVAMVVAPVVTFCLDGASEQAVGNSYTWRVPLTSAASHTAPVSSIGLPVLVTRAWRDDVMPWVVAAWFLGAMFFGVRMTGGWVFARRMKSGLVRPASADWQRMLDEIRARVRVSRPVQLLVSALVRVPTVVGWLRPVVLVPVGALAGLPVEHVEALLAHELAHVRRHDYLVNILQSVAETLLFYHPAVWWVSKQIRNEREHCCDDIAVGVSGDALIYVRALTTLESCRAPRFSPALAANGGSLSDRVGRLLGAHPTSRPASGLAVALIILLTALVAIAQTAATKPSFEVASIKLSPPEYVGFQSYVKGERYTALAATVRNLVSFAYKIRDFQISGGPPWAGSTAFNISAKVDGGATPDQVMLMMQNLLAERFGLKFHRVTKSRPGYALVVDKGGSRLVASKNGGPGLASGFRDRMIGRGADMGTLVAALASKLESPVADRTGLKGLYDFTLTWTPDEEAADSLGPSMFTALRETLGLRMEPVKNVPVDILVIDSVEKPLEN